MAKLRDIINYEPEVNIETIEIDGETHLFKATPNASLYADSILLDPSKSRQLAEHWTRVTGHPVSENIVAHVLIVHMTLQVPEGEQPYDVTDIAALAVKKGPDFMKMVSVAYKVSGLAESTPVTAFEKAAQGNSEPQEPTS